MSNGKIWLPFNDNSEALTLGQIESIYNYVDVIITNLDEYALNELFSGNSDDVDSMMETLYQETYEVLYGSRTSKIKTNTFDYLDRLTESVDETLRYLNLNYFVATVMPEFEMNWHHIEWFNLVQIHKYVCFIAARDHSKSFSFSAGAYPAWKLYRYHKNTRFKRYPKELTFGKGIIITNEYSLAKEHLKTLKENIENNDILRAALKPTGKDGWGKEEIICKNGARLAVKSYGSKMRGFHPGWVVPDDFLNDSNLYSQDQREKYINYFHSVIMNAIVPGGQVVVVGTPFSDLDLYADLKQKPGWKVFEYPAIFPDGRLLWEGRYDVDTLLEKLDTQGSIIFSREILVKPVTSESTIFPYKLVSRAFVGMEKYKLVKNRSNFPVNFRKIAVGVDIARSANVGADFFVWTVMGIDSQGTYWLIAMGREKGLTYNQQLGLLKRVHRDFRPDIIGIEDNQMQTFLLDGGKESNLPVVGLTTNKNKYDLRGGIPGMVLLFEQDKMRFPRGDSYSINMTDIVVSEFTSIAWTEKGLEGVGAHDDTVLSIWKAIQALNYTGAGFSVAWI